MSQRTDIKIIKRGERERAPATPDTSKKDGERDFSREVISTVTSWVREFQRRQRAG
jgi:hypothetical protein